MMFLRIFQHLLPNARAWRITAEKQLREFFEGLSGIGEDVKLFFDQIYLDLFPDDTRELDAWENQFGLVSTGLTDQQRRDRLTAAWQASGGQDPTYIQETLQSNGFPVFVHEFWEPGTEQPVDVPGPPTVRNPFTVLRDDTGIPNYTIECGEALAECGEVGAECGESVDLPGYPLVNKVRTTDGSSFILYTIPVDPTTWPYFLYIGGEVFGDIVTIDPKRQNEFEALMLQICPAQQWIGVLANYA